MSERAELPSRRDQYAAMTRDAVVGAARQLFAERGYASTTVAEIAGRARVSPATIYAQCGGKEGLLRTLMDTWTAGQLVLDIITACRAQSAPAAKVATLAQGYVEIYESFGDIVRIVAGAAASTPGAEEYLRAADARHLAALHEILQPLSETGDLQTGLSVEDAARIVFFHFRFDQWSLLAHDFSWGVDRATEWLTERVKASILQD